MPENEYVKRYANLEHEGQVVDAIVTNKSVSETSSSDPTMPSYARGPVGGFVGGFVNGARLGRAMSGQDTASGDRSYSYVVAYKFSASNKEVIEDELTLSAAEFDAMKLGTKLAALYHPQSPRIHRLLDYSTPYQPIPLSTQIFATLIFGGLGAFLMWRNWPQWKSAPAGVNAGARPNRLPPSRQAPANTPPRARTVRAGQQAGFGRRI